MYTINSRFRRSQWSHNLMRNLRLRDRGHVQGQMMVRMPESQSRALSTVPLVGFPPNFYIIKHSFNQDSFSGNKSNNLFSLSVVPFAKKALGSKNGEESH